MHLSVVRLISAVWMLTICCVGLAEHVPTLTVVSAGTKLGKNQYKSVQDAVAAAPDTGANIHILPGVYREVVYIDKPRIHLHGDPHDPSAVKIVYANGASNTCGTSCSATMFVTGDDFLATSLTIANDWSKTGKPRTQALALSINGDRAVLRDVRLLGNQDTLLATSKACPKQASDTDTAPATACKISRQFYDHCYIEGEVDFIFGNAKAVFEGCEIHSVVHPPGGFLTANGRNNPNEDSAYVFDHCKLTADSGVDKVFLGRPWRDYAKVIFLNTEMGAHIQAAGWSEWHKGETKRLETATYAEFHSTGPGATPNEREPLAKQLTPEEAKMYDPKTYLEGPDHWTPERMK